MIIVGGYHGINNRKGGISLMIYVGIDVAKLNHFASAISSDGEELIKPFKFTNDADGFQLLSSHLDSLPDDSFIIGLESTAHYGDNLVRFLVNECHKFCVITRSRPQPSGRTTSARPKRIRLTPTSSLKP